MPPGGKVRQPLSDGGRKPWARARPRRPRSRRFLIDFAGGELAYYLAAPEMVEIVASVSTGRVLRTFLSPNPDIKGFRAGIDVTLDAGQWADIRAFLRARTRALTETWTRPWKAP